MNISSEIYLLDLLYIFLDQLSENQLSDFFNDNHNMNQMIITHLYEQIVKNSFQLNLYISQILCDLSGFSQKFLRQHFLSQFDKKFLLSLKLIIMQKDYYVKANIIEFLINIFFEKQIVFILLGERHFFEPIFNDLLNQELNQQYLFRIFQFLYKLTEYCSSKIVGQFFISEVEIVDVLIKQTQCIHHEENLIIVAQILENLFDFGEEIKELFENHNIFLERVLSNEEYASLLEQLLSHKNQNIYKTYRNLLQKFFECEILDNQLQMLKDTQYFEKKNIKMTDQYFRKNYSQQKYIDNLGLEYTNKTLFKNFRKGYVNQRKQRYYNVHKDKNKKQCFLKSQEKLFEFNSSYGVKNMVFGHFQIPQNIKMLNDKNYLYLGSNCLNLINIPSGKNKQITQLNKPESLNTSSKFQMASGVASDKQIFIYDLKNQEFLLNESVHSQEIANYTKFIESNNELIVTWNSPEIGLMDLNTLKLKQISKTNQGVNHIDYNLKNQIFVTAQDDPVVQICDMRNLKENLNFKGHDESNFASIFLNENYFATGGEDVSTRIWDIRQPNQSLHVLVGKDFQIGDLIYDDKRNFLYVLETNCFVYCYDLNHSIPQRQLVATTAVFQGFAFNKNKDKFYVAAYHSSMQQFIQEFDVCQVNQ